MEKLDFPVLVPLGDPRVNVVVVDNPWNGRLYSTDLLGDFSWISPCSYRLMTSLVDHMALLLVMV